MRRTPALKNKKLASYTNEALMFEDRESLPLLRHAISYMRDKTMKTSITLVGDVSDLLSLEGLMYGNSIDYSFPGFGSSDQYHEVLTVLSVARQSHEKKKATDDDFLNSAIPSKCAVVEADVPPHLLSLIFSWYAERAEQRWKESRADFKRRWVNAVRSIFGLQTNELIPLRVFVEAGGTIVSLEKDTFEDFLRRIELHRIFDSN